jgi:SAM-dependent methyltransferase
MVEAARERLAQGYPHVRALVADATTLPFPGESFDTVLLFHTLTYAERPVGVVAECARVLRPGGRLVVLSLDEPTSERGDRPVRRAPPGLLPAALGALLTRAGLAWSRPRSPAANQGSRTSRWCWPSPTSPRRPTRVDAG